MFSCFEYFKIKRALSLSLLAGILLQFSILEASAQPQIVLAASELHEQMGKELKETLESEAFKVELCIVPLRELVRIVKTMETDFFVVSIGEILYALELTWVNLAVEGRAVAPADVAEKVHLTTLVETNIKHIRDLADQAVSLGPRNSATEMHALDSIDAQRETEGPEDFKCHDKGGSIECRNVPFRERATKLLTGDIKAFYATGEVPIYSVEHVADYGNLQLVSIPENIVDKMSEVNVFIEYIPTEIDMSKYESDRQEKVSTAGIPAAVAATDKAKPEMVHYVAMMLLKNPLIDREILPGALKAVRSFMRFHPVALELLEKTFFNKNLNSEQYCQE